MFRLERAFQWLERSARQEGPVAHSHPIDGLGITRRGVLVGSAAISASLVLSRPPRPIKVVASHDGIEVELGEHVWRIDRSTFGTSASFNYRQQARRHIIEVQRSFTRQIGLPGDFSAILQTVDGQWWLSLDLKQLGARLQIPFEPWLDGRYIAGAKIHLSAVRNGSLSANVALLPRPAMLGLTPDWRVRLQGEEPIVSLRLDGLSLESSEALLTLGERREGGIVDLLRIDQPLGLATIDLINPKITSAAATPGRAGSQTLQLEFDAIASGHAAVVGQSDGSSLAIVCATGQADARTFSGPNDVPDTPVLSGLRLAPASLIASATLAAEQRLLVARVAPAAHPIETRDLVLSIAGRYDEGVVTTFRSGESPPIKITTDLYAASVPVAGADSGEISFSRTSLHILVGGEAPMEERPPDPWLLARMQAQVLPLERVQAPDAGKPDLGSCEDPKDPSKKDPCKEDKAGLLFLDRVPFFAAPLENGKLRILRSRDLLSLTFGFRNFTVEVQNGRATLVPKPIVAKPSYPDAFAHRLIVEFPPQHVAEEAKKTQLGIGGSTVKNIDERDRLKQPGSGSPIKPDPDTPFPTIVRARLSGPTRLVFRIKKGDTKNLVRKDLSVKTLTEWSDLAQVVSERALASDTSLTEQLNLVGIDKSTNRGEALVKIIQSVRRPREDETAIEFPYRLLLSPDSRAQWITPQYPLGPLDTPTLLWNARLDPVKGAQSIRAVWARDLLFDFLRGNKAADTDPGRDEKKEPPLTLSLSRSDRRELVTLSAIYGLPALGRVVPNKDALLDPANIKPGKSDDAPGTVQPFPPGIGLWGRKAGQPIRVADEGLYVPKPLKTADISFTAMGGTFVGEGQWEPPSPIVDDGTLHSGDPDIGDNWRPTLRLERWRHRAVLGRDIFVEVAYKGFLFPIGHRASLLKVTERRFYPHPDTGRSTSYLIQRLFIVIGNREKSFPAVGQSFDGRMWPAQRTITMLTAQTPDLRDPEDNDSQTAIDNGRLLGEKDNTGKIVWKYNGLVFWPRIGKGEGNEVIFEFRKDEDEQAIAAPFIFVDNVAAHEPKTVKALLDYYRGLPDGHRLRRASHGSVRRRYAPSLKDGETDFDTQSWNLSATGRFIDDPTLGQVESFRVDGVMEGADQPPYYPVMRTANIKVQSIDRLIGRSAGSMTVAINELYARYGFSPDQNPSELFLDVLSPAIQMDFSGGGDAVGGLAKPNARLVALSRKFGPVGGRGPSPRGGGGSGGRSFLVAGAAPPPMGGTEDLPPRGDYAAFSAGVFDPHEFLGAADSLPKLLGIFSLTEVLKVVAFASGSTEQQGAKGKKVPQLQEKTSFGGGGVDLGEQVDKAKQVIVGFVDAFIDAGGTGGPINDALTEIDKAVKAKFGQNFDWRQLYPRLAATFQAFLAALKDARQKVPNLPSSAQGLSDAFKLGSQVIAAGKALLAEAAAVRDNPMPPLFSGILDVLSKQWETVRRFATLEINGVSQGLKQVFDDFKAALVGELTGMCVGLLKQPETQMILQLIFGSGQVVVPYLFSANTAKGDPGDGRLRLGSSTQDSSTVIRANFKDANTEPADSLLGTAFEGNAAVRGLVLLLHRDNPDKWLIFRVSAISPQNEIGSKKTYFDVTVAKVASSSPSPFADNDPVQLASLPDFSAVDPTAVTNRISNALMYEIAGEPIMRAHAAIHALVAELGDVIDQNARDIGSKLLAVTVRIFDAALALARLTETSGAVATLNQWCEDAIKFAIDFCDTLIGDSKSLSARMQRIVDAVSPNRFNLPEQTPRDIRVRVDQARAAMAQAQERLARATTALMGERDKVRGLEKQCGKIADVLRLSGSILALRRDAVAALQDLVLQARAIAAALEEIGNAPTLKLAGLSVGSLDKDVADCRQALKDLVSEVTEFLKDVTSIRSFATAPGPTVQGVQAKIDKLINELKKDATRYKAEIDEISKARQQLVDSAGRLDARLRQAFLDVQSWAANPQKKPFPPDLAGAANDVLSYATQHDRRLAALVLQSTDTFSKAKTVLEDFAARVLLGIVTPIIAVYDVAGKVIDAIAGLIDESKATNKDLAKFLTIILSKEMVDALTNKTEINKELASLNDIKSKASLTPKSAAFPPAFVLRDRWSTQDPALVRSVKEIARIVESLAHGDLSAIINLDRVRALLEERLKDALLDFLPTKVDLNYDWQTDIQPFQDIFVMSDGSSDQDLTLSAHVSINLLRSGDRTTTVTGILKPFTVYILGGANKGKADFLSIAFRDSTGQTGARFQSVNGGGVDFNANVDTVAIGTALEFIKSLQSFLSYEGGGFYVRPSLFPLGIEAGFEYCQKVVPVGPLIFYNVAFSVSAQLPFQDRDARFRFALASADAPFMISYPPYGGGGFFAITSNGREIVQAECSFEFGAVLGVAFGPLSAVARVMAGIYVRQASGGGAYIKGFFHAVGEGSIACFSISVCIEVAIVHYPNGHMEGQSSYSFTFKVGFAEISYGVTAHYAVSGGSSSALMLANQAGKLAALIKAKAPAGCEDALKKRRVTTRVRAKTRRWDAYRKYVDLDLLNA